MDVGLKGVLSLFCFCCLGRTKSPVLTSLFVACFLVSYYSLIFVFASASWCCTWMLLECCSGNTVWSFGLTGSGTLVFFGLCHLTVSEKPNKAKTRSTTGISQQRYFGLFLQLDTVSIPVGSRPQTSAGRFNQGPMGSSDIQSGSLVHLFLFVWQGVQLETSSSTTALSMLGNRALLWMKDLLFDIPWWPSWANRKTLCCSLAGMTGCVPFRIRSSSALMQT